MKVVYDTMAYCFSPHGGIVRIFDELLQAFATRSDFTGMLYLSFPPRRLPPLSHNVRVRGLPKLPHSLRGLAPLQKAHDAADGRWWRWLAPDIYHPTFFPAHDRFRDLPTVLNIYDLIHERVEHADEMPDHDEFSERKRRAIQHATRLVCISEATKRDLLDYYDVDPSIVRVVHLGRDPAFQQLAAEEIQTRLDGVRPDPERPFILYVGSRQRYKNFHRLLRAYNAWPKSRDMDLLVVGPPRGHADHVVMDLCGSPANVRFLGHVSDEVLCALYNQAAFFVYPSLYEGFGIPLLEAMASGCPLCVSDIAPFHEVAGGSAVYFDPASDESMTKAFDDASALRENTQALDQAAHRADEYSWDACVEEIWNIYRELC